MLALLLAILTSYLIAVLSKFNELANLNRAVVIATNYLVGAAFAAVMVAFSGIGWPSASTWLLGLIGGLLWPGGFFVFMWGVRRYGIAMPGVISRLSLAVPVLFALLFLGEPLTTPLTLGLLLTFVAFLFIRPVADTTATDQPWFVSLLYYPALLVTFGLVTVWVNVFNTYAPADEYWHFLLLVFVGSGVFSWAIVAAQRQPIKRNEFVAGLVLGVPNFATSYFLLISLTTPLFATNSAVAYILFSVGTAVLTFLTGVLAWREPVSRAGLVGVGLALAAIVLLNF